MEVEQSNVRTGTWKGKNREVYEERAVPAAFKPNCIKKWRRNFMGGDLLASLFSRSLEERETELLIRT